MKTNWKTNWFASDLLSVFLCAFLFVQASFAASAPDVGIASHQGLLKSGGFEYGLDGPWGHGQYGENGIWWNSRNCRSSATVDTAIFHGGLASLHLLNSSARAPNLYGTTVQAIRIEANRLYRISVWAKADHLASNGGVSLIVDKSWNLRPIALPAGSYDWRRFEGTFQLPSTTADIRILMEDQGQVWLDDMVVEAIDAVNYAPSNSAPNTAQNTASLQVAQMTYQPRPAQRGQEIDIQINYANTSNASVSEQWTLTYMGTTVMPPFTRTIELSKTPFSHHLVFTIPTQAQTGMYTLQLHASALGYLATDAQLSFEIGF